jgi:hypothetical protein
VALPLAWTALLWSTGLQKRASDRETKRREEAGRGLAFGMRAYHEIGNNRNGSLVASSTKKARWLAKSGGVEGVRFVSSCEFGRRIVGGMCNVAVLP